MEWKCCKCEEYNWPDPQDVVWSDPVDSKGYCIFHASYSNKYDSLNGKIISSHAFESIIHERINEFVKIEQPCKFDGSIFPFDLSLSRYSPDKQLPDISFSNCRFYGKLTCQNTYFCGEMSFTYAKFFRAVYFWRTHFRKIVDFTGSQFKHPTYFHLVNFDDEAKFSKIICSDRMLRFIHLDNKSIENMNFDLPTVYCIRFLSISKWPERLGLEKFASSSIDTAGIRELYLAMKKSALEEHDQLQVSHWHYQEKQRTLKDGGLERLEALTLKLYDLSSGFGERAVRAGVWLLTLIGLSFLLNATPQPIDWNNLWGADAANATMATIPFAKDIPGDGWVKVARGVWQFLIAVQFTLFALAVRNRFRR